MEVRALQLVEVEGEVAGQRAVEPSFAECGPHVVQVVVTPLVSLQEHDTEVTGVIEGTEVTYMAETSG